MIQFTEADVARLWPCPDPYSDKYSRGVVGVDTGSVTYPGAGVLSVLGALYSGAGFIRYAGPDSVRAAIVSQAPSVTFGRGRVQAWLVGSGWDVHDGTERMQAALAARVPLVVDAGALQRLPSTLPTGSLLTPHIGELARLLGADVAQVSADPGAHALQAAQRWNVSVLVKGHNQYVARPDGEVAQAVGGPAWTAQAGSGDVLAGIAASVLASGCDGYTAGLLAASIQAMTATRHPGPYPPDALARFLPEVIGSLVA
ncbi:MAG: NAD(P)H-hydrate dehydratase [Propionibacteriaceae bacterium]|jgi:hydroxyethylthiazole kinase-like uncharacterized protein yjeF|nr:NAD(P)H-hydrate dehydratase [Propionibacteriaceae bacterium]